MTTDDSPDNSPARADVPGERALCAAPAPAVPTDPADPARLAPVPLCLMWARDGDTLVLSLVGDADSDAVRQLDEAADRLAAHHGPVLIDLAGVEFLDSTGVHFLVDQHCRSTAHHHAFRVTAVRPHPARVLAVCGIYQLLTATNGHSTVPVVDAEGSG